MTRLKDISLRFSILRPAHRISTSTLATLLGLKAKANITLIEKAQCNVSSDTIFNITELFAIESTWLFRQSKIPYTENTMPLFEQLIRDFPINKNLRFIQYAPDYYSDYQKRVKFFSLQDRANIVFLVRYYNTLTTLHPYLLNDNSTITGQLSILVGKIREKVENGNFSFRFKDPDKEFEYVKQALAFILYNPERIAKTQNNEIIPSSTYIPPLYQVYDFQDGEEIRDQWYRRIGDK